MIYFKFPFQENLFTIENSQDKNTVQFFSFVGDESINFNGEIKETSHFNENEYRLSDNHFAEEIREENQEEYFQNLEEIIQIIKDKNLPKLVYSRRKIIPFNNINIQKSFENICENYPNAFRYIFQKEGVSWMGAFSEVLGKFNKKSGVFETMSLAGTLPITEDWTKKEIEEQKPVTDFIKSILNKYTSNLAISATYDHISGNIKHLRTDFKAQIQLNDLENIIQELHPTPAVCGIPKDFCKSVIAEHEKYPRELYSGYIRIETKTEILYFVNLRCSRIFKNAAHIFVGGGITAQSNLEKEWQETELKSQVIAKNLVIS